jgi:hypothetical protein
MATVYDVVTQLQAYPALGDLARGFSAEVADPAWLLGRQWQMGEHQGEDASSPVKVAYRARLTPVAPLGGDPRQDPTTTPAEAIVESEPGDSWTAGRRVSAGRAVEAAAAAAGRPLPANDPTLRLAGLPAPYQLLDGSGFDGRVLWTRRAQLRLDPAWFGRFRPPDPEPADLWNPAELAYDADFSAQGVTLRLRRHDGGDLDWYGVDATAALPPAKPVEARSVFPGRISYPGAPLPRWWQIEDGKVDIGGYGPDRAHFATLLLIDLIVNQSDDWFTFPVDARAGHVVTMDEVVVTDSFGDDWTLAPPADGWSMFATTGLGRESLVVWASAASPLAGPVLDDVVVGMDEDANLVWAVEQRLNGRDLPTPEDAPPEPPAVLDASGRQTYAYRAATHVPPHWHPYPVQEINGRRRFVQGRAADLSGPTALLLPAAESDLLHDPASGGKHPVHQIEPAAIPFEGVRLERRTILARRTDAAPVLWTQRRRMPLLTPPALRVRFDVLEPVPPTV